MKLVCKGDGIDLITLVFFNCNGDSEEIDVNDIIDVVGDVGINSWNVMKMFNFLLKSGDFLLSYFFLFNNFPTLLGVFGRYVVSRILL
jgi:hypothetical protein